MHSKDHPATLTKDICRCGDSNAGEKVTAQRILQHDVEIPAPGDTVPVRKIKIHEWKILPAWRSLRTGKQVYAGIVICDACMRRLDIGGEGVTSQVAGSLSRISAVRK